MCTVTERLGNWGARPQEGVARVLGDELFYRKLLRDFSGTRDMEMLIFFVKKGAYRDGFRIAHSLKGASDNLSLTPLSQAFGAVVELLRPYSSEESGAPDAEKKETLLLSLRRAEERWSEFCRLVA